MPNHSSGCVRVRCSRSRKKDAGGFLAAAIGLTLHIDNGNDRAFFSLRLIAIECHYLPYPGRQGISFFEAHLAIANAGKAAAWVGHDTEKERTLVTNFRFCRQNRAG